MKKTQPGSSSKKRLNKLCKDSAFDLSRFGLDQGLIKNPETEKRDKQQAEQKAERRKLLIEVKKKIDGLSS